MINSESQSIKWYKTWWGLLIIIILLIIFLSMLIFGFYVYTLVKKINSGELNVGQPPEQLLEAGPYQMENSVSPWTGSAEPKITIVEFADFNCPFCRQSYPVIRKISSKYKNDVKIIFRHYPLTKESSLSLALAGECANEQGLFWHLHDKFFQTEEPADKISRFASQLNLNQGQFNNCFKEKKYLNKIKLDILDAQKAQISGTPTWFINGHKVSGFIPRETFMQIVEELLN